MPGCCYSIHQQTAVRYLIVIACFVITGCGKSSNGPEKFQAFGEVTLNGVPLVEGDIIFRSTEMSGHAYAGKIAGGKFSFETEAGPQTVEIKSFQEIPGETREDNPGEIVTATRQVVPLEYNADSTLSAMVNSDNNNEYKFELTGEPPKEKKRR